MAETQNVNLYHQNLPHASIIFAAMMYALAQAQSCGSRSDHTYHHTVHSDVAQRICEAPVGREDPRCVGYFAR